MRVLGVTAGPDAAAAVVVDGVVVAAVQEHRFGGTGAATRPSRSVEWCLDRAGVPVTGLDAIALVAARDSAGAFVGCDPTVVPELHALAVAVLHGCDVNESAVLVVDRVAGRALIGRGRWPWLEILDEVHGSPLPPLPWLAEEACRRTGIGVLCLAGNAARDRALARGLRESGRFDALYVPPAPDGCGAALGAALAVAADGGEVLRRGAAHPYLGPLPEPPAGMVAANDVAADVAALLAAGRTVGWAQGRAEFATVPLGNRAVLVDPRSTDLRGSPGASVACVPAERAADWFRTSPARAYRHGGLGVAVRPERRGRLAGVPCVDDLAIVHAVDSRDNARFHELLCRVAALTGVPVLLARDLPADPGVAGQQIDVVAVGDVLVEWDPRDDVAARAAAMPDDVWPASLPA